MKTRNFATLGHQIKKTKHMKTTLIKVTAIALVVAGAFVGFSSFEKAKTTQTGTKYMMMTTIESIIPAGLGRSRMYVTDENGKQTEDLKMENLYSMVGINMDNINTNNSMVVMKLQQLCAQGWELSNVATGVQSPSDQKGQGIYMTRYLLQKKQ
jgi:hypothetical protein